MSPGDEHRTKMLKLNIACLFALAGFSLALYENWRLAVAVFLLWWSANIVNSIK